VYAQEVTCTVLVFYTGASEIEQKRDSLFSCLSARGVSIVVSTRWQHLCVNDSGELADGRGASAATDDGRMRGTVSDEYSTSEH
jgi:hypothetical protein